MFGSRNLDRDFREFEKAARKLCEIRNERPDELVQYPDPNGYAVCRKRPRWQNYAVEMKQLALKMDLISIYA